MIRKKHFGDLGHTQDFNGQILPKDSKIINLIGNIDELIAYLGLLKLIVKSSKDKNFLTKIQNQLQFFCAILSGFYHNQNHLNIYELEHEIAILEEKYQLPQQFYQPGDKEIPTFINLARTICRRTERSAVNLKPLEPEIIKFLNRLSTYLFILTIKYDNETNIKPA
jgi:cob(I)alamin adenosyltransferase